MDDAEKNSFDFEKSFQGFLQGRQNAKITPRELGVLFSNLSVVGSGSPASYHLTFESFFNPRHIYDFLNEFLRPPRKKILQGFEGVVWPGEMLLVLGRPSAGCSTLLKTLSCQTHSFSSIQGSIHLGPFTPPEISSHFRGDVTYCPEDDIHFPTLTVQQTFSFAAATRTPRILGECPSPAAFRSQFVDVLENMLGLTHARNTIVGNESLRGVSGGEKKRVSVGELLAVRPVLGCWDNTTRGLDSSTALELLRNFRTATSLPGQDEGRLTTVMALYQASDALYEVFDKTCVLYEGRMAYFGPAHRARAYFEELGFERASDGQTVGDFLVSVTDPKERIIRKGFESSAPRTPAEFAERFLRSELGRANREEMEKYRRDILGMGSPNSSRPGLTDGSDQEKGKGKVNDSSSPRAQQLKARYMESVAQEKSRSLPKTSPFTVSMWDQLLALMKRRVQILRGSIGDQFMIFASFVIFGIVLGTVYYNSPESTDAYFSRAGALFYTVLFLTLSSMSEIPILFSQRPIIIRQYHSALYLPFLEALSQTLVDIPISFITTLIYSIIIYFMVGLQTTASQFFTFFVTLFALAITMKVFVRCLSAAVGSPAPAQTLAGVALLALILYTGFALPRPSMIGGLRWITYLNPMRWGFEILMSNEFHTLNGMCSSSNLVPSGPGYSDNPNVSLANQACATLGTVPGQNTVDGNAYIALSYQYSYGNVWRNLGIVFAYGAFFLLLLLLFTEINTWIATEREVTYFARTSSGSGSRISPLLGDNGKTKTDEEAGGGSGKMTSGDQAGTTTAEKPTPRETNNNKRIFTWQHLTYDVPISHGVTRRLLDDVSGYVAPGKLTALMGASGAGKTTLLNTLAQRVSVGVVSGDVCVDGKELPEDFQGKTGYCQQLDVHLSTSTVREALSFSAKLRQPKYVPVEEKEAYVDTVLRMCGLEDYEHAIVGSLNLEYRKRTTIGVELAAKPELLLFLDEPTTGLDSQSAWAILTFLKELAEEGQAVLCTIHQPSAELFNMFDRILLLKSGGQTVYQGDVGPHGRTLVSYFERNGGRVCPGGANPAEYMLDVIGAGAGYNANASSTTGIDWHQVWANSPESKQLDQELSQILEIGRGKDVNDHGLQRQSGGEYAASWCTQTMTLLKRDFQRHWRDPMYLMNKLMLNIIGGVFMGFTFFQAKGTLQGTQNKVFATFMSFILSAPIGDQIHIPFIQTRSIYELRERASRVYSWTALTTAQLVAETVFNVIGSTVYFVIWYWIVGLPTDRAGYSYLMMGFTFPFFYTSFVLALAAMAPSSLVASLLYFGLFTFAVTFTGMLQPYRRLGWWKWMYRVNPFTYLVEGFVGQAVGHAEVTCSSVELVPIIPPSGMSCSEYLDPFIQNAGGYLAESNDNSSCLYCAARTTDEFLGANFNIEYSHHWRNLGVVWGYVVFNVIAIFVLTYLFRIKRPGIPGLKRLFGGRNTVSHSD